MLLCEVLPTGISDLRTCLTDVNIDYFFHRLSILGKQLNNQIMEFDNIDIWIDPISSSEKLAT